MSERKPSEADPIDATVQARMVAGDLEGATTQLVAHYGPEILGFLRAISRDDDLAGEAFAAASEQFWLCLPSFRWESGLRTWCYQLARHTLYRLRRDPRRRPHHNLPLSLADSVAGIRRTTTEPYLRTDVKEAFRTMREALDPLDHEILVLRIDRRMSWKDIARALTDEDATDTVEQRAAAYRKRFERAKLQLRELAADQGLFESET